MTKNQWEENSSDLVMFVHQGATWFRHFSTNVVSNIVYRGHYMSTQKTNTSLLQWNIMPFNKIFHTVEGYLLVCLYSYSKNSDAAEVGATDLPPPPPAPAAAGNHLGARVPPDHLPPSPPPPPPVDATSSGKNALSFVIGTMDSSRVKKTD